MLAFGVVMRNMVLSDIRLKFNYAVNPSFLLLTQFCVCVSEQSFWKYSGIVTFSMQFSGKDAKITATSYGPGQMVPV